MSEETKNPLIESFLELHEALPNWALRNATTTTNAQAGAKYAQNMKSAFSPSPTAGSENMTFSGGGPSGSALPNPTLGSSNMRFSSGSLTGPGPIKTGNPIAAGGGTYRPSIDTAPKIDNSASINRAKTDYQTRVAGVERQNPILAPGKLESGNLQVGSRGDSVKELQRKLGIKDDGIFGKDTAKKLREFQQKNNLKVDGIYGRQSASAMNKQSGMNNLKKENPVGAYVSSQTVKPMSPMAGRGSSGADSKTLPVRTNTKQNAPVVNTNQNVPVNTNQNAPSDDNSYSSYLTKPVTTKNVLGLAKKVGGDLNSISQDALNRLKKLQFNSYEPGDNMTNKLIEAFMQLHSTNSSNLFTEAKKAKKLDPVGKEDEDIDNDGDKDKSDSYLHNRRKAIAKAMKEAKDPYTDGMSPREQGLPVPDVAPAKKKPVVGNSVVTQTGKNSSSVTKSTNEEVEQIDEALSAAHKAAIAKHVGKMWGKKGNISFNKEGGKHFVSHSDGIETHVHSIDMKKGVPHVTHFMTMQESAEQLDELKKAALMAVRNRASGRMMDDPSDEKAYKVEKQASKRLKKITDAEKEESSKRAYKAYKEEVEELDENDFLKGLTKKQRSKLNAAVFKAGPSNPVNIEKKKSDAEKEKTQFYNSFKRPPVKEEIEFSEAELEHIAAILEANPIAPVPDDYSGAAGGVSKRDLSDETVAEEEMKRGRGRPKGSKSGSKHGAGSDSTVETKNLAAQIRFSRPSGGNFMLKHPTTGVTKAVPAKAATEFYNKYSSTEKPAQKQAHHDEFLAKHFGSSEKPKTGITLPKMPAPKS